MRHWIDQLIRTLYLQHPHAQFEAAHICSLGQVLGVFQKSTTKIKTAISQSVLLSGLQKDLVKKEYERFVHSSNSCSIQCRNYMFGTQPVKDSLRSIGLEHYLELRGKRKQISVRDSTAMDAIEILERRIEALLRTNSSLEKKYLGERERKKRRKSAKHEVELAVS